MRASVVKRIVASVLPVVLGCAAVAGAYALERMPARKFRLRNGLVLIVQEDHSLPIVAIQTMTRAGRITETPKTNGISALLAELMSSQGTASRTAPAFYEDVIREGSKFEVFADEELLRLETTCAPDLAEANLRRQAEMLLSPNLSAGAVDAARERLLARLDRREQYPREGGTLDELSRSLVFDDHPYGLPLADAAVVRRLQPSELQEHLAASVKPEATRVVVAGDCEPERMLEIVQGLFGHVAAVGPGGPEPVQPSGRTEPAELRRHADVRQAVAQLSFLAPSLFDEDFHAMIVAQGLLAEGKTSRMVRRVVTRERLVDGVGSFYRWLPSRSHLWFDFACDPGEVETVVQSLLAEIQRLRATEVSIEELERSRTFTLTQLALGTQKRIAQAELLGRFDLMDDMDLFSGLPDAIERVTASDVRRAARRWLEPSAYALAVVLPSAAKEAHEEHVWTGALSNGINLVTHRDPSTTAMGITIVATIPAGGPADEAIRSRVLAAMLGRGNTIRRSSDRTLELLEAAGTQVDAAGGPDGVYISANATRHNLDGVLTVLREMVFEPDLKAQDLEAVKRSVSGEIEDSLASVELTGLYEMMNALFPDHPYGTTARELLEALRALSLEDVRQEHRRLFATRNVHLGLSGNLSHAELEPKLEALFGQVPASDAPAAGAVPPPAPDSGTVRRSTHPRGSVIYLGTRLESSARRNMPALSVLFRILGVGPQSLLSVRLQEAGVLEATAATLFQLRRDGVFMLFGYRVRPGKLDQSLAVVKEAIASVKREKFSAEQIESTRRFLQGYFVREFEEVQTQASRVVNASAVLGNPELYSTVGDIYRHVKPEDVEAVLKHLDDLRFVLIDQE